MATVYGYWQPVLSRRNTPLRIIFINVSVMPRQDSHGVAGVGLEPTTFDVWDRQASIALSRVINPWFISLAWALRLHWYRADNCEVVIRDLDSTSNYLITLIVLQHSQRRRVTPSGSRNHILTFVASCPFRWTTGVYTISYAIPVKVGFNSFSLMRPCHFALIGLNRFLSISLLFYFL